LLSLHCATEALAASLRCVVTAVTDALVASLRCVVTGATVCCVGALALSLHCVTAVS